MEQGDQKFSIPSKRGREEEDVELFVGSLSWDATEDDIQNLFSEYGEVQHVKLIRDYEGRSRGRAFVSFSTAKEATAALAQHEQEHMGRPLVVKYSSDRPAPRDRFGGNEESRETTYNDQSTELFCSSLSWDATEEDIQDLFKPYGEILNVKLIKDYQGRSRGRAFIKFSSAEEAEAGLAVNGKEHMGRDLAVKWSSEKPSWNDTKPVAKSPSKTVYVRNMSYSTTEDTLREFFADCGEVVDIRLAMSAGGYSRGFAHIEFDSADASAKACKLAGERIDGRAVQVKYASEKKATTKY